MRILSDVKATARKHYPCDGCRVFDESNYGEQDVSADDWLIIEAARADRNRILPGMKYRRVVYEDGGELCTYRERLDVGHVLQRNEMYDEC